MPLPSYPVARLMWAAPLLLYAITAGLLWAGVQQRAAERGADVPAEVVSLNVRERAEITRGSVRLRYTPPEAAAPVERDVELPMSFLKELEGREGETIPIRVAAGSGQIVLGEHPRATWVLTFAFAAMALIGALGLTWMVAAWNRYLGRHGDPSEGRAATAMP
jgi:hypothetical protein